MKGIDIVNKKILAALLVAAATLGLTSCKDEIKPTPTVAPTVEPTVTPTMTKKVGVIC